MIKLPLCPTPCHYLGVDVSKAQLEVAGPGGDVQRHANTPAAIARLLKRLPAGSHLVLEATGGYERPLADACHQAGLAVSVLNPARVRYFAQARGCLAKSDPIDATVLREFGAALSPAADPRPDPATRRLAELVNARDHLVAVRVELSNALKHFELPAVRRAFASQLAALERRIAALEQAIGDALQASAALQARSAVLRAQPGIGPLITATLLAHLPELGHANRGQIAALAGLAPYNRDSGKTSGPRFIRGGRPKVRRSLYLAAFSLIRSQSSFSAFYHRLRAQGKAAKVALIATARKLLCHLNSQLKSLPA